MEKSGGRVGKPAPINTFVMVIDRTLNTSVLLCFRSVLVLSIRVPFRRNIDVPFSSSVKDVFYMTKSRWFLDTIYTPWETGIYGSESFSSTGGREKERRALNSAVASEINGVR